MAGLRVGRVKIYNVKQVKTEVTLGPLKLGQNQKSFWILQINPLADVWWVALIFLLLKKHVLVEHPNTHVTGNFEYINI